MTIGNRIKKLRKEMNFTQEYVAEKLNVSRQAVSKWEKDISNPDTNNIICLAELLDSSVEYIASGKNEKTQSNHKIRVSKEQKKRLWIISLIVLLLIVGLSIAGYIYTRPVKWDAGACGGGYGTWIFDKYNRELTEKFLNGMGAEKENIISAEAIRGTHDADWEDRQIFLEFDIKYKHKTDGEITEKVRFIGTRYWIDSFKWSGAIITCE